MSIIILIKNPFLTKKYNNKSNLSKIREIINNYWKRHNQKILPFKDQNQCKSNLYKIKLNHNNLQILNKTT
jgi:hypothetical protein